MVKILSASFSHPLSTPVKRISRRPSFVKREAYLESRKINACERRDTRYERRVRNDEHPDSFAGLAGLATIIRVEEPFADTQTLRCDLNQFIRADIFECELQAHFPWRREDQRFIGA